MYGLILFSNAPKGSDMCQSYEKAHGLRYNANKNEFTVFKPGTNVNLLFLM